MEWKYIYSDFILVPIGVALLLIYHAWLGYKVWKARAKTMLGLNRVVMEAWAQMILKDGYKNGMFMVQSMRNSIMSSSLLAGAAMTLTTMVGYVLGNHNKSMMGGPGILMGGEGRWMQSVGVPVKLVSLLPCFLVATLCYVRSATFYNNASFLLISIPLIKNEYNDQPSLEHDHQYHLAQSLVWASIFRSIGTRAFVTSIPIFLWFYGPIAMFSSSLLTFIFLLSQDSSPQQGKRKKYLASSYTSHDITFHKADTSPLIDLGPFPVDSVCQFCPHI